MIILEPDAKKAISYHADIVFHSDISVCGKLYTCETAIPAIDTSIPVISAGMLLEDESNCIVLHNTPYRILISSVNINTIGGIMRCFGVVLPEHENFWMYASHIEIFGPRSIYSCDMSDENIDRTFALMAWLVKPENKFRNGDITLQMIGAMDVVAAILEGDYDYIKEGKTFEERIQREYNIKRKTRCTG